MFLIYAGEGEQQADLEVINYIIPTAMKRRMKPEYIGRRVRLSTKDLAIVTKSDTMNLSETTNKLTSIPYASAK